MNRRSFFKQLAIGAATFTILPPATTYERVWKAKREWMVPIFYRREVVSGSEFTQFLTDQIPSYDSCIINLNDLSGTWKWIDRYATLT